MLRPTWGKSFISSRETTRSAIGTRKRIKDAMPDILGIMNFSAILVQLEFLCPKML